MEQKEYNFLNFDDVFYKSQAHVSSSTCGSDHIDVQNSSRFLFDEKSLPDGEIVETIEKNPKKRKRWEGRAEFFLSVIGYAVGLGAVWRFPYKMYKNGGGVFLIPYLIFFTFVGLPLVFLELCVGQFTSTGPLTCWRMTPIFRGIGLSMNIVNGYLCIYYNMILAYSLHFLYISIFSISSGSLPWNKCDNTWSSPNCFDNESLIKNYSFLICDGTRLKCSNGQCYSRVTTSNVNASCLTKSSELISLGFWKPLFPSQDYWTNAILEKTNGIDYSGQLIWNLVLSLFIAWLLVYLMVAREIKVSGKLIYLTAWFPYLILLILCIRGLLLPGSSIGIKHFLIPDLSRLKNSQIWIDAADQTFFSLSVTYGGLIALSSYNPFHKNVMKNAILVSLTNCIISIFAGFVVFAYMGHLAFLTGKNIETIVQAGQGLVYVIIPFAITTIKGSQFWAIIFFLMMIGIGVDTMMTNVETMLTSIFDFLPKLKKNRINRVIVITFICLALFSMGLIFCLQSGIYWIELFDLYAGNWAILLVAFIECISIGWIYGFNKFKKDISTMIGDTLTDHWLFNFWRISWCFISPLILLITVIVSWIYPRKLYTNDQLYPGWTNILGNCISFSTLSGVIIWAAYAIIDTVFIKKKALKTLFIPDFGWKPMKAESCILVGLVHSKLRKENEFKNTTKFQDYESCVY